MFFRLAKFEFNYFVKQPSFYVTMFIFFLLPFFAMISDNVQIGGSSNINFNSPHAITQTIAFMSVIAMFMVANFVGGTGVKDTVNKMDGMMLSMPIGKTSYLWGRLLGAFAFCLLVFLMVPLGTLIGSFWPTVDAERLGDTQLMPYVWAYTIFIIPNFLFCSVLFYILALKTRSMIGMYLGVVAFFILYEVSQQILDDPNNVFLATMLDPFGLSAFMEATRYWTAFERNTQLVSLDDNLLFNRLLWISISFLMIVVSSFLIDIRKPVKVKNKKTTKDDGQQKPTVFKLVKPDVKASVEWIRFAARTRFELLQIVKSGPFMVLCLIAFFSLTVIFIDADGPFGTANWPLSRNMADYIIGAFSLMTLVVITYYSAEIVWRERQLGIGDIVESTPIKNWSLYFPKLIALTFVIVSLMIVGIIFSVTYQASKSYTNFEWFIYTGMLSLRFIMPMVMNTILAVFIQILSPGKYIGMMIFITYFIGSIVLAQLGLEHNMWRFARIPRITYSDLNQYGHFLQPAFWYNLYWIGLTVMLIVTGFALWRRGIEYGLKYRLRMIRSNMGGYGIFSFLLGLSLFVGAGSFIYYNTRVLNDFISRDQQLDLQADYEKKYKQYESWNVPTITDVNANVDIYPHQRRVVAKGIYLIENKNDEALKKTLLIWEGGKNRTLDFTVEGGKEIDRDDKFYSTWIKFDPPLQPGQKSRLEFTQQRFNVGFVDSGSDTQIVENGTFLNNAQIFPHFGYNKGLEIEDRHERRKRDLDPPERLPKLEDSTQYGTNFIGKEADFINFETIVSTSEDQIAISPGYLQKQWVENGRRYFHYKMDAPIFNFVAFLSGLWSVDKSVYKDIDIEVYHHPDHDKNVDRMVDAVKASLDYYSAEFSPYQHRQVRIIEFPRYASFAQSFSNTIPYSEDIGFIADLRDEDAIDYVYFVTAHEMAHQWWGHQLTPANVQGSAVLSETLSEYSAYMVMEKQLGKDQLRQFLKWEMDRYLKGRSSEALEEMPLYKAENQRYIHYQKGGVVMYALRDRFGEKVINSALKKFLEKFQYASDPYPTTLDLLQFLKAEIPESGHIFVDELFKKITVFDFKMKSAKANKLENGNYELELIIDAKKFFVDGQGEETEASLSDKFDIGIFSKNPDEAKGVEHVLYFKKHEMISGENTVTIEVDQLPEYAGIDPYIKMIDRNSDDNLIKVELN